jgi:hypothetical protein
MGNYYFLAPSLPPLTLGDKPEFSFEELISRLEINLGKKDLEQTTVLRRFIDLHNIRSLLLEESIDPRGNLNEKELDEALLLKDGLPSYVFDFLDRYDNVKEKVHHFSGLLSAYFREEVAIQTGFLRSYLSFEREWRLVMLALRSKQLKRDVVRELQFEDFSDPMVAQILAQRDADRYDPPIEYQDLKDRFSSVAPEPWDQYKLFAQWRFRRIEELVERPFFSLDWILSYMAQLLIVENWTVLDNEKGKMVLDALVT